MNANLSPAFSVFFSALLLVLLLLFAFVFGSVRRGSTARAHQAAARDRVQQAARQNTAEKREAADRNAAALIEEEERDEAAKAQSKVRGVELAPVCGVSDAVSLSHGG